MNNCCLWNHKVWMSAHLTIIKTYFNVHTRRHNDPRPLRAEYFAART